MLPVSIYPTHFYISYSFLNVSLIFQYLTHFSISVYHIIVSYTTLAGDLTGNLTQDLAGNLTQDFAGDLTSNLTQDFAGDLLLWVYRAGYLAPDLQRNFAPDFATELCRGSYVGPCRVLVNSLSN